jgi:hypothetical protein
VAKSRRSAIFHLMRIVPVAGIAAIGSICLFLGHDETDA